MENNIFYKKELECYCGINDEYKDMISMSEIEMRDLLEYLIYGSSGDKFYDVFFSDKDMIFLYKNLLIHVEYYDQGYRTLNVNIRYDTMELVIWLVDHSDSNNRDEYFNIGIKRPGVHTYCISDKNNGCPLCKYCDHNLTNFPCTKNNVVDEIINKLLINNILLKTTAKSARK